MSTKKVAAPKEVKPAVSKAPEHVSVVVNGQSFIAPFKEFRTGSKGWYCSGKVLIGESRCQLGVNIIIIGSKPGSAKKAKSKKEGK